LRGERRDVCARAGAILLWLTLAAVSVVAAQEPPDSPSVSALFGGGGGVPGGTRALDRKTIAYTYSYEQPNLIGPFGLELSDLNQGHLTTNWPWYWPVNVPLHYRDSYGALLDWWTPRLAGCRLGAAAGVEAYFDTTTSAYRTHYEDRHGVGARTRIAAECFPLRSLAVEVQAGRSFDIASYDASVVMIGLHYMPPSLGDSPIGAAPAEQYLELVAGDVELDSFRAELQRGRSEWLTYGHHLWSILSLEASLVDESITGALQRSSIAGQLAVAHRFAVDWLQLFAAVGPSYARTDALVNGICYTYGPVCDEGTRVRRAQWNLLWDYGATFSLPARFALVLKLGRMSSDSGRTDTDLLMAGLRYELP
jgi:hypothetical protein